MSVLVLDASVAVAWLLRETLDPSARAALDALRQEGACVPPLWHYEVRNAFLVAQRRDRTSEEETRESLDALEDVDIETDQEADLDATMDLAVRHRLSFYDALYLELARRRRLPLATRDTALARAAEAAGIRLVA